jgi:predicted transcriptional regulator
VDPRFCYVVSTACAGSIDRRQEVQTDLKSGLADLKSGRADMKSSVCAEDEK